MGKPNEYNSDSIETIETDRERVRKYPHLYIPDKRLAGSLHVVRESLDNAQDEVMQAGGSVELSYDEQTREVTVKDTGRGIPLEKLKDVCEVLNSSGKFEKGGSHAYNTASGLHGIGNKLCNFLSTWYEITSTRDGKSVTRRYEEGIFVNESVKKVDPDKHGTEVRYVISDQILKETDKLNCSNIMKMIEEKTDACPGFSIKFKGVRKNGSKVEEKFKGLDTEDLLTKYFKPTSKIWSFEYDSKSYDKCRIAFGYDAKSVTSDKSTMMGWCNYIQNKDGGTHVDAINDAIQDYFKKYMFKEFLSDKDKKDMQLKREDVKLGLCAVIVLLTNEPEYQGQYKERMISVPLGETIHDFMYKQLDKLSENDKRAIATILRDNIRARLSSIRARTQVKKPGNGLSQDEITKYIRVRHGCTTDYNELILVEGDSAGGELEAARYDYQEIYMLRGRVDNIYSMDANKMSDSQIISDLSSIIGLVPCKKGFVENIHPDRIFVLSDADPDGYAIRCGVIAIMARAFPQVIEDGRLFIIEPPLFSFTENGKKIFTATNREYINYLYAKFSKHNDLYWKKEKMSKDAVRQFLLRNEEYLDCLKKAADANICTEDFTELVCYYLTQYGTTKKDVSRWDKMIKEEYSSQLKAEWIKDGFIRISGIKDGYWNQIDLDSNFLNSKKIIKLVKLMSDNLNRVYDYSIEGKDEKKHLSISDVLRISDKYKGSNFVRYKGIGQMDAKDLRDTCLTSNKQRLVQITTKDINLSFERLSLWNSEKQEFRDLRREFMINYIPDLKEIST